jgi:hypothetical protein
MSEQPVERGWFPPCTATAEEIRIAILKTLDDDPELLVEDHAPEDLEGDEWEEWMNAHIDAMQALLRDPSALVDAILCEGRDHALEWMLETYSPTAFLDTNGAREELMRCIGWEFERAFFRGDFGPVHAPIMGGLRQ